jgi:hypothetical protein
LAAWLAMVKLDEETWPIHCVPRPTPKHEHLKIVCGTGVGCAPITIGAGLSCGNALVVDNAAGAPGAAAAGLAAAAGAGTEGASGLRVVTGTRDEDEAVDGAGLRITCARANDFRVTSRAASIISIINAITMKRGGRRFFIIQFTD